jgi:hypothetical protein
MPEIEEPTAPKLAEWIEEILFLITITPITPLQRYVLLFWAAGYNQTETAGMLGKSQQWVSWTLAKGLRHCLRNTPVTFTSMCRKPIYRRPAKPFADPAPRWCTLCGTTLNPPGTSCRTCRTLRQLRAQQKVDKKSLALPRKEA